MGYSTDRVFFWTDDHEGGNRFFVCRLADRAFRTRSTPRSPAADLTTGPW